jgi:hypothetical protein
LLDQPTDFQKLHIPMPYEASPAQSHPPFPTPEDFGDPLEVGGWKDRKPSWVQVVPQVAELKHTTKVRNDFYRRRALLSNVLAQFKCFEPPVKLSRDELQRLKVYAGLTPSPVISQSGTMPQFPPGPPGSWNAQPGVPNTSSKNDQVSGSGSSQHLGQDSNQGGTNLGIGGSFALQALYETETVKRAFASLAYLSTPVLVLGDDDDDDDDEEWEDNMDPVTFARYFAPQNPYLAKIVQAHDAKMRQRLNEGIVGWMEGVQYEFV